jgi:hypothetical protein
MAAPVRRRERRSQPFTHFSHFAPSLPTTVSLNPLPGEKKGYWWPHKHRGCEHSQPRLGRGLKSHCAAALTGFCVFRPHTRLLLRDVQRRPGAGVASLARGAGAGLKRAEAEGGGSEEKRVSDCDVHSRLPAHRRRVPVSLSHPGLVPVRPRHSTRGGPPPAGTAPVPSCAHTQPWASTQQAGDAPRELHLVALGHLRGDQRQGGVDDLRHVRLVQGFGGCAWQQQRRTPRAVRRAPTRAGTAARASTHPFFV